MLSVVKLLLTGEVGVCALNSHGNYIVDRGKSWKNHGIVFLNFYGNPDDSLGKIIWVRFEFLTQDKISDALILCARNLTLVSLA